MVHTRDKETADLILAGWRAVTHEAIEREARDRAALKVYTSELLKCMDYEMWTDGIILPLPSVGAFVPKAVDEETPEDIYNRVLREFELEWQSMVAARGREDTAGEWKSLDVAIHRAFLKLEPEARRKTLEDIVFVPTLKDRFSEDLRAQIRQIRQGATPKTAKSGCLLTAVVVLMAAGSALWLLAWQLA
jgi:hypothetical protein